MPRLPSRMKRRFRHYAQPSELYRVSQKGLWAVQPNALTNRWKRVLPKDVEAVISPYKKREIDLFGVRAGKVRRTRSVPYQRRSVQRLLEQKLGPLNEETDEMKHKIYVFKRTERVNSFNSSDDLHRAIPRISAYHQNQKILLEAGLSKIEIRLHFKRAFPDLISEKETDLEEKQQKLKMAIKKMSLTAKNWKSIQQDVDNYIENEKGLGNLDEEHVKIVTNKERARMGGNKLKKKYWKQEEIRNLKKKARLRLSNLTLEMRMLNLFGIHFAGRNPDIVREEIRIVQKALNRFPKK